MINRNKLAVKVAETEGKKIQVNIAQIKEVIKWTLIHIGSYSDADIMGLINKVRKGR